MNNQGTMKPEVDEGGCICTNMDDAAVEGEFMWMMIHLHPPASTFMHVHPHKKFISRVEPPRGVQVQSPVPKVGGVKRIRNLSQLIATFFYRDPQSTTATPSLFQRIPAYSNVLFFRAMNHGATEPQSFHRMMWDRMIGKEAG